MGIKLICLFISMLVGNEKKRDFILLCSNDFIFKLPMCLGKLHTNPYAIIHDNLKR